MSELTKSVEPVYIEFRLKFTHASTAIGSVYFGKVKLMDFISNLNFMIPEGMYPISLYDSPKFKRQVILLDVPNHKYIEVHPADWSHELRGCFAPGSIDGWQNFPGKSYSKLFADSNSNQYLDSLIAFVTTCQVSYIKVTHSECIRVYLTGRG